MSGKGKRLEWIDIAKGIGILAMLVGHNIESIESFVYSFHMPLFFILAGYTIKPLEKGELKKATYKDFQRLIIPCIITRFMVLVYDCVHFGEGILHELYIFAGSLLWGGHNGSFFGRELPNVGRIWFLLALFWAKMIYRVLLDKIDDKKRMAFLTLLAFGSMYIGVNEIRLPQSMDLVFVSLLFMEIGRLIKNNRVCRRINNAMLLVIFAIWTFLACNQGIWINMNSRKYPGYGLCLLVAVLGSICIFKFSESIEGLVIAKPLILFGRYSMVLVVLQTLSFIMFTATNNKQRLADMVIECFIVVCYAFADITVKNLIAVMNENKKVDASGINQQEEQEQDKAEEYETQNGRRLVG